MFEKEAEKWLRNNFKFYLREPSVVVAKHAFKNGAEFGYNKAKEWQYPCKGKYPKEREDVWCYCKGIGIKFCCVGHTIVGGDNKVRWWANNKIEELRVIAWKEIVLPELKESE